jgi:hypothetical protein
MFIILGLILFALWYVSDKALKERFVEYVKWPALAIIVFFFVFDINMFIETNRFIEVRKANPLGLNYVDFGTGNTTLMYGLSTEDTAAVMSYHYADIGSWPIITGLLELIFLFVGGCIVLLLVQMWYDNYRGISNEKRKVL